MVMGIFWGMALLPRMAAQAAYDRAKWIGATGILSVGKENKRPAAAECSRLHGRGGQRAKERSAALRYLQGRFIRHILLSQQGREEPACARAFSAAAYA